MDSMYSMMRVCSIDGCEKKYHGKGKCLSHYLKEYRKTSEGKAKAKEYSSKPEVKLKRKEYNKKYSSKPENKLKKKEYDKQYNSKPEVKLKKKEHKSTPEYRLTVKKYNVRPEVKLKKKEYQSKPENKLKRKEYDKQHPEVSLKAQKKQFKKLCSVLGIFPTVKLQSLYISWSKTVKKILGNYCHVCGSTEQIQIHHIFHKMKYPLLSLNENNGIPLCKLCHCHVHGKLLIQPLQNFPS